MREESRVVDGRPTVSARRVGKIVGLSDVAVRNIQRRIGIEPLTSQTVNGGSPERDAEIVAALRVSRSMKLATVRPADVARQLGLPRRTVIHVMRRLGVRYGTPDERRGAKRR